MLTSLAALSGACTSDPSGRYGDPGGGKADDVFAPDASPSSDLDAMDASPTAVTVTVYDQGAAAAAVAVHYHGAEGGYLGSVTTDESGRATIEGLPDGGAVTAPVAPDTRPVLRGEGFVTTITGVSPGDELVIGDVPGGQTLGVADLGLPGTTVGDSDLYRVYAGCGVAPATFHPDTRLDVVLRDDCLPPGRNDFTAVAYATDTSDEADTNYYYDEGYALITDGQLRGTRPDLGLRGQFPFNWTTEFAEHTVKLVNPTGDSVRGAQLLTFRDGIRIRTHDAHTAVGDDADRPTFRHADGFFDEVGVEVAVAHEGAPGSTSVARSRTIVRTDEVATADAPQTTSLDLSVDLLGRVSHLETELDPMGVTWTPPEWGCRDNPGDPDAAVITIRGHYDTSYTGQVATHGWTVLAPVDGDAALALPKLPADVETDLWPKDQFERLGATAAFTSDSGLDWDAIRTGPGSFAISQPAPPETGTRCTAEVDAAGRGL